ncbi:MAG TPA: cytidylate kinase-like family protein, partial [Candidatus Baltobacteraceae bacterium]|nr:cytidylate kinase-like family protein [Candidatus Baltobacteraceae bacterium]
EQLPVVVARRLHTSPQAVESAEDLGKSMSERMLRALESGTPEIAQTAGSTFDEDCLREIQEAVREYAATGRVIIVGRGANAILGGRDEVLRVFMHAPRDWRMRRLVEEHHVDERSALVEIDRIDRAREQYMRVYYGVQWGGAQNYDMSLNTSAFGLQATAGLIAAAVHD